MGKGYLIDSNAIIDYLDGVLPSKGKDLLFNVKPRISIISQIEVFCYTKLTEDDIYKLNWFVKSAIVFTVVQTIIKKTIELRLKYRIKLPDAIIAATALYHNLILITRNLSDLGKIEGLEVLNPHSLQ